MGTGRNAPCPCGSGKKYKRCCGLKEREPDVGGSVDLPAGADDPLEGQVLLTNFMNNFRRVLLDKKPHIKEYYKARRLFEEIVDSMAQYYHDGKFELKMEPADGPSQAKEATLELLEGDFDLETREGANGFYDMLIYKSAPNMRCITEEFLEKHRYRKPEKVELLHSMLESRLGLFAITGTVPEEGYAYLREVFTGDEYTITDVGLSGSPNYDTLYIYTRIIAYRGLCFDSGLNFVFEKTDSFIAEHIRQHRENYSRDREFVRFLQLYNRYSAFPEKVPVIANTRR